MAGKRGGGSAFPVQTTRDGGPQPITDIAEGVTLRDYFAVHGDAPTHAEIVAAGNGQAVYVPATDEVTVGQTTVAFAVWWAGLTQIRRARLLSEVRYLHADAMLLVRDL